jgi:CRP-like cAMP-binding protein
LLLLDEKYTTQDNSQLAAPVNLSRKDLASYIGTSIEVLVRILKQFEKSKIVRLEAKYIFIEDFDAMINLAKTNSFE